MSEQQFKAFLEKVKIDTGLQETLKAAADSDAVLAIAKEAGFSISADDFTQAQSELSDADLEAVSGGAGVNTWGTVNTIWHLLEATGKALCDMRVKEDISLMTTTGEVNNELTSMAVAVRSLRDVYS
jgi:predicted ribosomally synthesized peptide with nif11-like leader